MFVTISASNYPIEMCTYHQQLWMPYTTLPITDGGHLEHEPQCSFGTWQLQGCRSILSRNCRTIYYDINLLLQNVVFVNITLYWNTTSLSFRLPGPRPLPNLIALTLSNPRLIHLKRVIVGITLNYIWWWDSSSWLIQLSFKIFFG